MNTERSFFFSKPDCIARLVQPLILCTIALTSLSSLGGTREHQESVDGLDKCQYAAGAP